jgi:hypothetical protein
MTTGHRLHPRLPTSYLFEGQLPHLLLLACLVPGALFLARPALGDGLWLGVSDRRWLYTLLAVTILHQVLGWFVFRFQLVFSLFTRLFGKNDLRVWGWIFFPFLLARPLLTIGLGIADYGSLAGLRWLQIIAGVALLLPAAYTGWSTVRYFGLQRALGGDHFRLEYRDLSLVRQGAFKYSANAMYTFVFLLFWSIALLTGSRAALASALFQHAYIWVHMCCTEAPDMRVIYGEKA